MRWLIAGLIVIIISLLGLQLWMTLRPLEVPPTPGLVIDSNSLVAVEVVEVFDGDTVEVEFADGRKAKVRYLGVDTPETVAPNRPVGCYGYQASDRNKKLVDKKQIYLQKDTSDTDKYDRLLRYVYLKQDNGWVLLSDYLIRYGFGTVLSLPPDNKLTSQLLQAENEARTLERGLWKKC